MKKGFPFSTLKFLYRRKMNMWEKFEALWAIIWDFIYKIFGKED